MKFIGCPHQASYGNQSQLLSGIRHYQANRQAGKRPSLVCIFLKNWRPFSIRTPAGHEEAMRNAWAAGEARVKDSQDWSQDWGHSGFFFGK
jgi:hypothetical protein